MELLTAVSMGDTKRVEELASNNTSVNQSDRYGNTGLHLASSPKIVSCLLNASCDFNAKNFDGDTALNSWYKLNLKSTNNDFNFNARRDIIMMLIKEGADCNIQNNLGQTFLHTLLLYGGSDGMSLTEEQLTELLTIAVIEGHADINIADYEMCIPLHYAVLENWVTVTEVLLQGGSDVNSKNVWGSTALHFLSCIEDCELISTLLAYGANPLLQDRDGKTCIHHAASIGNSVAITIVMDYYLQLCNDTNVKPNSDSVSLVNGKDVNGQTAVHLSAINKEIEATAVLIAYDADVNATDNYGATSLHYGAAGGTVEIVEMLVRAGADTCKSDCNGLTATELAYERHYYETASAIERARDQVITDRDELSEEIKKANGKKTKLYPADNIFVTYIHQSSLVTNPFDISHIDKGLMDEMYTEFEGDFERYLHGITHVLGIGRIPEDEEVQQIQVAVENFVERLAKTMAEIDNRFQGSILKSGSWYEGTKVGDPNEFDYMLCLQEFEKICNVDIKDDQIDEIIVYKKDGVSSKNFDLFFREDELQSFELMERFVLVAKRALSRLRYDSNCHNLQVQGITEHSLVNAMWLLPGTVTCELKFTWTGPRYKQLVITVDLVPAIYIGHFPGSPSLTTIAHEVRETGCHIVSKSNKWRLSFSLAEKTIFDRLHTKSKEAYICAKIALHPAVSGRFFLVNPGNDAESEKYWIEDWDMSDKEEEHAEKISNKVGNGGDGRREVKSTVGKRGDALDEIENENACTPQTDISVEGVEKSAAIRGAVENSETGRERYEPETNPCKINNSTVASPATTNVMSGEDAIDREQSKMVSGRTMSRDGTFAKLVCTTQLASSETVTVLSFEESLKENEAETLKTISSINNSKEVDVSYQLSEMEPDGLQCIDGRSLIPSYLLKLVLLNCIEKSIVEERLGEPRKDTIEKVTTKQIFEELKSCLQKRLPVPYFFCKNQDFLKKAIKNREMYYKMSFIVTFISALFQTMEL